MLRNPRTHPPQAPHGGIPHGRAGVGRLRHGPLFETRHQRGAVVNLGCGMARQQCARRGREVCHNWSFQQQYSLDIQNDAAELKLRAARTAGELLREMEKAKGVRLGGHTVLPPDSPPRLVDFGITKMQSHRWQHAATVQEPVFEDYIQTTKATQDELTSAEVYRLATQHVRATRIHEAQAGAVPAEKARTARPCGK